MKTRDVQIGPVERPAVLSIREGRIDRPMLSLTVRDGYLQAFDLCYEDLEDIARVCKECAKELRVSQASSGLKQIDKREL